MPANRIILLLTLLLTTALSLLILSCKSQLPDRIVGSWYFKDFPGLVCEFKNDGTYHYTLVSKEGDTMSADGNYSIDGSKFTAGAPEISPDSSNNTTKIIMSGIVIRKTPPKGMIVWKSDDEFTITSRTI